MDFAISVPPQGEFVEYTGRWEVCDRFAASTACGSSFRIGFKGTTALLAFDISRCQPPFPHLYLRVDGGGLSEVAVDRFIRVHGRDEGAHEVQVILKSSLETQDRWEDPVARVVFLGCVDTEGAPLPADERKVIEFVGDSITEGSSVYPELTPIEGEKWLENLVYTNDVCSSYSWQTARLLNLRASLMGYGSTGVTKSGGGGVPRAAEAYRYLRKGVRYHGKADIVVLNHGANDRDNPEEFVGCYRELLDAVWECHPGTEVYVVSPFCGAYVRELSALAEEVGKTGKNIRFVNTSGWLPAEPLHPLKESHLLAAKKLAEIIGKDRKQI